MKVTVGYAKVGNGRPLYVVREFGLTFTRTKDMLDWYANRSRFKAAPKDIVAACYNAREHGTGEFEIESR